MKEVHFSEIDYRILNENVNTFKNLIITIDDNWYLSNHNKTNELSFINCIFTNGIVFISHISYNDAFKISFKNCKLNSGLTITKSEIKAALFNNTQIPDLEISESNLCSLSISNNCKFNSLNLYNIQIGSKLNIYNKNEINNVNFDEVVIKNNVASILENNINHFDILHSSFEKKISIIDNKFKGTTFKQNIFHNELIFENNLFINDSIGLRLGLIENEFKGNSFFKFNVGMKNELNISNNIFFGIAIFNDSIFNSLNLINTTFKEITSFQDSIFDKIKIDRINFEKNSFFDDIEIKDIDNCDRRTIRIIKYQLLKSDNKIDYNRFRAYELNALKKELLENRKKDWNEIFILYTSSIFSNNGLSWLKALKNTIIISLFFYILLYISLNIHNQFIINAKNINTFLIGYFRFLIPTELYNPLNTDKVYLTNFAQWLILIFGKLFIGIGIYEIIRSFRKYKK